MSGVWIHTAAKKYDNAALGFGPRDQTAHLRVFFTFASSLCLCVCVCVCVCVCLCVSLAWVKGHGQAQADTGPQACLTSSGRALVFSL